MYFKYKYNKLFTYREKNEICKICKLKMIALNFNYKETNVYRTYFCFE